MKPTEKLRQAGQSLWLDNITRDLLDSGELQRRIDQLSVTGLTSNPTIFDHAIEKSEAYDQEIGVGAARGDATDQIFFQLAIDDLRRAADLFAPIHQKTVGVDGFVSLEVSPLLAYDPEGTIAAAQDLHQRADRPNLFIKIPGTKPGLKAIEESIFAGIPINVTLLFSSDQYQGAAEAYLRGLERRIEADLSPDVASVASIFVSRWDKAAHDLVPERLQQKVGIAAAGRAYQAYRALMDSERWQRLANFGARPQRLLFASTSTKDPKAPDVLYVSALAAPFTINTMPDETLLAFADHGEVGQLLAQDGGDAKAALAEVAEAGVDLQELAEKLQRDGAQAFNDSWTSLMKCIEGKVTELAGNS